MSKRRIDPFPIHEMGTEDCTQVHKMSLLSHHLSNYRPALQPVSAEEAPSEEGPIVISL